MNPTVLIRLTLAKTFLVKAQNALKQGNDDLSLATAVVDMHDCIDNLLGVLASELIADQSKDYLTARFIKVGERYSDKFGAPLPNQSDVTLLNTMRNGVKHNGILPNTAQVISVVKALTDFSNDVTFKVFGVRLEDVSLISQVSNENKRRDLEDIEKDIAEKKYESAMKKSAEALFKYHDSTAPNLDGILAIFSQVTSKGSAEKANIFPERTVQETNLKLLEEGVDPYLYYRFGNLVPKIGYDNLEDKNLIYDYPSNTWHEKNWTAENATFCLNFLTKLFLGQQRTYAGYRIVHKRVLNEVTFIKDSEADISLTTEPIIKKFSKGDKLYGLVDGFINGEFLGYQKTPPDKIRVTEIDTSMSHFEVYDIPKNDVSVKTISEEFEDSNI